MKKELKDYLHLYLGCECLVEGEEGMFKLTGISYDDTQRKWWTYFENTELAYSVIDDTKPILRPLSDMTEEELSDCVKLKFGIENKDIIEALNAKTVRRNEVKSVSKYGTSIPFSMFRENGDHYMSGTLSSSCLSPEQFTFLLSKHFDLFNLIEAGLAIDKTTLK